MMMRSVIAALLAASAFPAAAADIDKLAAAYGARPSAWGVQMSPDGDKIVYLTSVGTRGTAAVVADIATGTTKVLVSSPDSKFVARWCAWKSQARIICSFGANRSVEGFRGGFGRLLSLASDGSSTMELGMRVTDRDVQVVQSSGYIIDWLPDDPKHVMMSVYVPERESIGTTINVASGRSAKLVDVENNRMTNVEAPSMATMSFGSDNRGNVRFKTIGSLDTDGYLRDNATYMVRNKGSKEWTKLASITYSGRSTIDFEGFDDSGDNIFVLKEIDGRRALMKLAADGTDRSEVVLKDAIVDIDGVHRIGKYNRPVAASLTIDVPEYRYFDPVLEKRHRALSNALPGKPPVNIADESWDGTKNLILAGGVSDPGTYYRFDTTTKQLSTLLPRRPDLATFTTAPETAITYTAADGTKIPGYLTLPPGGAAKGLPAIIMPHGGPQSRDEQGFDWLAQFYAQLGYAVLKPNYRGSEGYGAEFYKENGWKSWRTAMGDINDGARWLAAQGIADPKKLVIVGWSYGGYAALQANVIDPKLYRAAVAIAPVTDLVLLKTMAYSKIMDNFLGDGPHMSEGSPAQNAAKIQVPVLMFQGDQDLNVDIKQARVMDSALASAGKEHRLVIYPGLDHQLDDSAARTDMLAQSARFLAAALAK